MNTFIYCNNSNAADTLVDTLDQLNREGNSDIIIRVVAMFGWELKTETKTISIVIE